MKEEFEMSDINDCEEAKQIVLEFNKILRKVLTEETHLIPKDMFDEMFTKEYLDKMGTL